MITQREFSTESIDTLKDETFGISWPVVYILNDKKEAYIGESYNVRARMKQHMNNEERLKLTQVSIINDETFNKSATLDIESKLIEYMSADQMFKLQNGNGGLSKHNYYQRGLYDKLFKDIWKELQKLDIVKHDLHMLENSDLFKYTPYKSLTQEQYELVYDLSLDLIDSIMNNQRSTMLINGEAGTGKTVVAMYLMKLLVDADIVELFEEHDEVSPEVIKEVQKKLKDFEFALVVPMDSLRKTLKMVAKNVSGLKANMVIGPHDVDKKDYDLLIVDESHRLNRGQNIVNIGAYRNFNKKHNFPIETTQLEWIYRFSTHQIFFYDEGQSIKPADVLSEDFVKLGTHVNYNEYPLKSQLRALGGNDYIEYLKQIFSDEPPKEKKEFENYEFKMFDSVIEMRNHIIELDEIHGLSRLLSGFSYEWSTKGMSYKEARGKGAYDFMIEEEPFVWNTIAKAPSWVNSDTAVYEVGSIHTIQGFDLNYAGIIIGEEIGFEDGKIVIYKEKYKDINGKKGMGDDEDTLREYIMNIYRVLLSRSIHGTFVYVVDEGLRNYLQRFISVV